MARPTVKFMSYNSTGLNSVKITWIKELMKTCDISFLGLQEHFKKTKTIDRFFKSEFPSCNVNVLPAYREEGRDTGRAKGGLCQFSSKTVGVRREKVTCNGWRIQAEILHLGDFRLLWVNVYFPTDPQVTNFNEAELVEVHAQLETVLEAGGYDDCICGGDWNYDERRKGGFGAAMRRFLEKVGLVSVWEKFPIDFTHLHTDNKSSSILDNFYLSPRLLEYVESAGPVHLGDNFSRHSPIMLSLKLDDIPRRMVEEVVRPPRHLAWDRAESQEKQEYKARLMDELQWLEQPVSLQCNDVKCKNKQHSEERDAYVLDVMGLAIQAAHSSIPLTPAPQGKGRSGRDRLPGWKENVEPLKTDSKFWYAVWLSAGRPTTGALHAVMVNSKVKYRRAVRQAQRLANTAKARCLLEAAEAGDQALLSEMRKTLGRKKSGGQELPDSLEGAVGCSDILDKFGTLYSELYNSCGTEELMSNLKGQIEKSIDCRAEGEVSKITTEVVKEAVKRMKSGKVDVSQAYTSDMFCNAPEPLQEHLAAIFRSFLVHGTVPITILTCSFLPLLKPRKKPEIFDSYRAIAGSSQMLKLFEYVLLEVWGQELESESCQFGFKAGTGTTQCSWLLLTVAEYFVQRGSPTFCCLLDVSKGFDRVKFSVLFSSLLTKLPAIVVRVLVFCYMEQSGFVKLGTRRSANFRITNGTRQGSVTSPALWAVYVDPLLAELRHLRLGCHVAGVWMGAYCYADDLSLHAPTRAVLVKMLAES